MIFDVDGVLTDGKIIYTDEGAEIKQFDVQDGHGIKMLQRAGIEVALISGRASKTVEHRARGLGITRLYQGFTVKTEPYARLLADTGLKESQTGFMGDDLIDIPVMRRAGFSVAVPNGVSHIFAYAHYVTRAAGRPRRRQGGLRNDTPGPGVVGKSRRALPLRIAARPSSRRIFPRFQTLT